MFRPIWTAVAVCIPMFHVGPSTADDVEFALVSHSCSSDCSCSPCGSYRPCGSGCNSCGNGCSSCGNGCSSCGNGCSSCGGLFRNGGLFGGRGLIGKACGLLGNGCEAPDNLGKLFGIVPDDCPWSVGGWLQSGWHSEGNGLFNNHPDRVNLHQAWLYVEKTADTSCGPGLGGRMDIMYGVDAADTQAFGGNSWDTSWNRGAGYGWAMPQLYAEIATENMSTIIGHFYTLVGYEVVTAPDNFFYSHAMTMYNSEPFTHSGVLTTYNVNDSTTAYAGWTAGWDTGFERNMGGSSFLGGLSRTFSDGSSLTFIRTMGNFGARSAGRNGHSHSLVYDKLIGDKLNYVFQSDLLRVDGTGEDNVGINQYLFYNISDCWAVGGRAEWWKGDDITNFTYGGRSAAPVSSTSYYALTAGINYRPNGRTVIRPEVRYDWSPALGYDQGVLGVDWVTVF